jgi:hypothetical protein
VVAKIEEYFVKHPEHRDGIVKTISRSMDGTKVSRTQNQRTRLRTTSASDSLVSTSPDPYAFITYRPLVQKDGDEKTTPMRKRSVDETSGFGNTQFSLNEGWVYGTRSNRHVCNRKSSYESYTEYDTPRQANFSNTRSLILGTGSVKLTVEGPNGPTILTLLDTAYVPGFYTNLVSQVKFRKRGFLFNEITGWIVDTNTPNHQNYMKLKLQGDLWYLAHGCDAPQSTATENTLSTRSSQYSEEDLSSTRNSHVSHSSRERPQVSHQQETIETAPEITGELHQKAVKQAEGEQLPTPALTADSAPETYPTSSPTVGTKIPPSTASPRTAGVLSNLRSSVRTILYIFLVMAFLLLWGKLYPHLIHFLPFS